MLVRSASVPFFASRPPFVGLALIVGTSLRATSDWYIPSQRIVNHPKNEVDLLNLRIPQKQPSNKKNLLSPSTRLPTRIRIHRLNSSGQLSEPTILVPITLNSQNWKESLTMGLSSQTLLTTLSALDRWIHFQSSILPNRIS